MADVPRISAFTLWFFRRIVRGYFRRHFRAVRLSRPERFRHDGTPLLVYANHSSWWDPMVCVQLSATMPNHRHFAPMDAVSLDRYAILKRIGIFPVAMNTPRGAVQFLRTGEAILAAKGDRPGVLWVTPQGQFVDPRRRPLDFKPGLATLAHRVAQRQGACTVLPLAIEYTFWDERLPETLLHFGEAVRVTADTSVAAIETQLVDALASAMADLQALAELRDPRHFTTLLGGTVGTGGFYALGKRLKALFTRHPYIPEHTILASPPTLTQNLNDPLPELRK